MFVSDNLQAPNAELNRCRLVSFIRRSEVASSQVTSSTSIVPPSIWLCVTLDRSRNSPLHYWAEATAEPLFQSARLAGQLHSPGCSCISPSACAASHSPGHSLLDCPKVPGTVPPWSSKPATKPSTSIWSLSHVPRASSSSLSELAPEWAIPETECWRA